MFQFLRRRVIVSCRNRGVERGGGCTSRTTERDSVPIRRRCKPPAAVRGSSPVRCRSPSSWVACSHGVVVAPGWVLAPLFAWTGVASVTACGVQWYPSRVADRKHRVLLVRRRAADRALVSGACSCSECRRCAYVMLLRVCSGRLIGGEKCSAAAAAAIAWSFGPVYSFVAGRGNL